MASAATSTVKGQTPLERACDCVAKLFRASHATFIEFVSGGPSGTVAAESHFGSQASDSHVSIPCILLEEEAFHAGTMIFVPDVTREPKLREIGSQLSDAGIASLLLLPIKGGSGRTFGIVCLEWNSNSVSSLACDDVRCEMATFLFHFILEARHLHEANNYRHSLLERLDRFAGHLHEVRDIQKLVVDIPRLAAELVEASVNTVHLKILIRLEQSILRVRSDWRGRSG